LEAANDAGLVPGQLGVTYKTGGIRKRLGDSMKFGTLTYLTAVTLFGVLPIPARLAAQNASSKIISFDAPGAGSTAGSGFGTFPESINKPGAITGHYIDSHNVTHGFLRSPGGDEFITFDAPGAGSTAGSVQGTFPRSISDSGAITGHYIDAHNVTHGFLRSPGGDEFITFDAPGAGTTAGSGFGTFPNSINDGGAITGRYIDAHNVNHGFLRSTGGTFITFEAPGAEETAGSGRGTFSNNINDAGAITGRYVDAHNLNHGFLRAP
jgi:hypothetical protein